MDALGDSKSQRIVVFTIAVAIIVVAFTVIVFVVFAEQVKDVQTAIVTVVMGLLGKLGFDSGSMVYRSVKVDAPIRQSYAALDVAEKAKAAGVEAAIPKDLQSWAPPTRQDL